MTTKPDFTPLSHEEVNKLSTAEHIEYSRKRSLFRQWEQETLAVRVARLKDGLNIAFKALRKQGFIARQNFMCCGSCAGYALGIHYGKLIEKGKADTVKGVVTYNQQSAAALLEEAAVYLQFGQVSHSCYADGKPVDFNERDMSKIQEITSSIPTVEVGQKIVEVLTATGLSVDWDGSPDTKILVFATPETVLTEAAAS